MKLTCYPVSATPDLRPGPVTSPWMDATPNGWANRCLPLAAACQHGWEVLTPVGFAATWDGSPGPGGVRVELDAPAHNFVPKGHFGAGTVTFPIQAIYRTDPGIDLYVTGPPNRPKDGASPLSAIVETGWVPYGFTMNWALTRPGYAVRFEAGEPFCHLFPVPRDLIELLEPDIRPLESNPELQAEHDEWRASRGAFEANPDKSGWQKRYLRGSRRARLRLNPFNRR